MLHTEGQGTETGGGDFTVSGGRALVKVTLGDGNYRVTVEDLHVGVQKFHQELMDFSIKGISLSSIRCNLIMITIHFTSSQ